MPLLITTCCAFSMPCVAAFLPVYADSQPCQVGWSQEDAVKHYLTRMSAKIPHFETMEESDLNYIKMINAGERITVNNCSFGYLSHRIVFYLLNLHIKSRHTYFARAGTSREEDSYKTDASLSELGVEYAKRLGDTLIYHREGERQAIIDRGGPDIPLKRLTVWTSTRRKWNLRLQILPLLTS